MTRAEALLADLATVPVEEALYLGAPVAHIAEYRERQRLAQIETYNRQALSRHARARSAFATIHGRAPNAPLSREHCDALAGGNPEIRGALVRMFGAPVTKLEG